MVGVEYIEEIRSRGGTASVVCDAEQHGSRKIANLRRERVFDTGRDIAGKQRCAVITADREHA